MPDHPALPEAAELTQWRRHIHAHPETAFEEVQTSDFVAERLTEMGLEVHRGLAKTGVIGVLRFGRPGPSIGLRADMDALHVTEKTNVAHQSRHPGRMHACGHDGHTTMLLGAAKALAKRTDLTGTINFIFQPAEENEGGGRVMVEEGLFDKFPMERVYGMHNWPGLPAGQFALRSGPMMASFDIFEVTVSGKGGHAAMPHQSIDPVVVASQLVLAWQSIVSRNVPPLESAVISVTQIHAGDTWNVIPDEVVLRGTVRTFLPEIQAMVETRMRDTATKLAGAFGATAEFRYEKRYPATINTAAETETAHTAAASLGGEPVRTDLAPSMGGEDFAFLLQARPGCYVWIGNGPSEGGKNLHSPHYDFNDAILPTGVRYWVALAEKELGAA